MTDFPAVDSEVRKIALETAGRDDLETRYRVLLGLYAVASRGLCHGFMRLEPLHEVRPAKVQLPEEKVL